MKHECTCEDALFTGKDCRLPLALIIVRMGVAHMNRHQEVDHMFRVQDIGEGRYQLVADVFQVDIEI